MAGAITHLLVVDAAAKEIRQTSPELAKVLHAARPFLLLGSVSPDLPYAMSVTLSGASAWADRMHYLKTSGVGLNGAVDLGIRNLVGTQIGDAQLAWLAGYVAHCITDATMHPIVQAIVGPYHSTQTRHRVCEMIQDSLLFSEAQGYDLKGSRFVGQLKTFLGSGEHAFLGIVGFWFIMLKEVYGELPPEPIPQEWHHAYTTLMGIAEDNKLAMALSRVADGLSNYLYSSAADLRNNRPDEANEFYDLVPVPNQPGNHDAFVKIGFRQAVKHLLPGWQSIMHDVTNAREIQADPSKGQLKDFLKNWDLDTGADMDQVDLRVTFWPGAKGT